MTMCGLAHVFLLIQHATPPLPDDAPLLVVKAVANDSAGPTQVVDLRDLERYIVATLIRDRVGLVLPASSMGRDDIASADAFVLEFTVEQLEEAWRPRWEWSRQAYGDEDVLHVEVSIALKPTDGEGGAIGGLYDIHDYRAEDFGSFSRPQAVRGALYKAAADLTDEFVRAAMEGEMGEKFSAIQHPTTLADLERDWDELSFEWKFTSAAAGAFIGLLLLSVAMHLLVTIARLANCIVVPPSLRNQPEYLPPVSVRSPLSSRGGCRCGPVKRQV